MLSDAATAGLFGSPVLASRLPRLLLHPFPGHLGGKAFTRDYAPIRALMEGLCTAWLLPSFCSLFVSLPGGALYSSRSEHRREGETSCEFSWLVGWNATAWAGEQGRLATWLPVRPRASAAAGVGAVGANTEAEFALGLSDRPDPPRRPWLCACLSQGVLGGPKLYLFLATQHTDRALSPLLLCRL